MTVAVCTNAGLFDASALRRAARAHPAMYTLAHGYREVTNLLVALKSNHCLADVMRESKEASSVWVHKEIGERTFARQEG